MYHYMRHYHYMSGHRYHMSIHECTHVVYMYTTGTTI